MTDLHSRRIRPEPEPASLYSTQNVDYTFEEDNVHPDPASARLHYTDGTNYSYEENKHRHHFEGRDDYTSEAKHDPYIKDLENIETTFADLMETVEDRMDEKLDNYLYDYDEYYKQKRQELNETMGTFQSDCEKYIKLMSNMVKLHDNMIGKLENSQVKMENVERRLRDLENYVYADRRQRSDPNLMKTMHDKRMKQSREDKGFWA